MEFFIYLEKEKHVEEARLKRRLRDASNPSELDERTFIKTFRVNKDALNYIIQAISGKLNVRRTSSSIPPIVKITAALRFCAQGSYQMSVGNEPRVGMAECTLSKVLDEVFAAMEDTLCPQWIKFPITEAEILREKLVFFQAYGFPGILGCVDGTHVKIVATKKDVQHLYYNRKGFHSLNVMVVCDHKNGIRYVNAKYPESCHDSMVFNSSALKAKLEEIASQNQNCWLLGDAGYSLKPYLITPFRNAAPESPQSRFNKRHAKARCIVERTIGMLKNRFRCLLQARALHYAPHIATRVVNICAALHNICLNFNADLRDELFADEETEQENTENIISQEREPEEIRNRILATLD